MSERWTQTQVDMHEMRIREQSRARGEHSTAVANMYEDVALERDLHLSIIAEAKRRGWVVVHSRMDRPATCGVGTPDFCIAIEDGRTMWVEAKRGGAKLRPEQAAWMAALRRLGHVAIVVRCMDEFLLAVEGRTGT